MTNKEAIAVLDKMELNGSESEAREMAKTALAKPRTNYEKWEKEIREIGLANLAVKDGKPVACLTIGAGCADCCVAPAVECFHNIINWLYEVANEE